MIEVHSLVKTFGLLPVLRGVELTVEPGECVALLGPNGAGKSTLLRILATLSRPTLGRVRVAGLDLPAEADEARRRLGVLAHHPLLYDDLTAEENLRFYARMYALPEADKRIATALEQVGLARRRGSLVRAFSRGMQQRLAIARAMLHDPQVLLFDEPFTGLDQSAAAMLEGLLREAVAKGRTVLMTTHDLAQAVASAGRVAILAHGKIAFEAPRSQIDAAAFPAQYAATVDA
jgi:heme ABC exporter ATP-binding subunit CcmA